MADTILRLFQNILELFQGGRQKLDNQAFVFLWEGSIQETINRLETYFNRKNPPKKAINSKDYSEVKTDNPSIFTENIKHLRLLQTLLKLQGVISATKWGKSLEENQLYRNFSDKLNELQTIAKTLVTDPNSQIPADLKRWILSNDKQRAFRVMTASGQLPYLYREIPKGAVLLTNLDAYKASLISRGFSLRFSQTLRQLKKYINLVFTGSRYIHAEISLGDGNVYHQDKKDRIDGFFGGKGYVEERGNQLCFHDVRAPIEINSNEWDQVVTRAIGDIDRAKQGVEQAQTSIPSMIRTVLYRKRGPDYQLPTSFDPKQTYACSAAVSILLGMAGIDIGESIGKRAEDISPADLARSGRLVDFYKSGL